MEHYAEIEGIEASPLCRTLVARDGAEVDVLIYRMAGAPTWTLELAGPGDRWVIWDHPFATDDAAMRAVLRTMLQGGVPALLRPRARTLH